MNELKGLNNLPLWTFFTQKAEPYQITNLSNIVKNAIPRLETISNTFPTYTLHNHIHAENIVRLMGELLGEKKSDLSSLELFILISSAYLHDIGMAFTDAEKDNIHTENMFNNFLEYYPEALLQYEKNDRVPTIELTEWYCRWCHPNRIFDYLPRIQNDLRWGTISLVEVIGTVCSSHGHDAKKIKDDNFKSNFLNVADIKFCSIILRLADILDFDNSRSPEDLYKYLELKKRDTNRILVSDVEWRKHLNSDGFKINNNIISIIAGPDTPSVEHDIREFIKSIEVELELCSSLINFCSVKWNNFILPEKNIDISNIVSNNYKYGDFKFSLEQNEVLNLLMGENLYNDPYVFIRELLQNAIDTCRYREFVEKSRGNLDYVSKPIQITSWFDENSIRWIRIDDFGMGMNEFQILNYFLKIGKSFYNSSEFQANLIQLKNKNNEIFKPISLFGIGILSCYIVGDHIEISTKKFSIDNNQNDSIRLSLSGINSFYIYQSKARYHNPFLMPNNGKIDEGYRLNDEPGTSIAVRVSPKKDSINLNLERLLNEYIYDSPIQIYFNNQKLKERNKRLLEVAWTDKAIEIPLNKSDIKSLKKFINKNNIEQKIKEDVPESLSLYIIPMNFSEFSPTKKIKGQGVIILLDLPYLPYNDIYIYSNSIVKNIKIDISCSGYKRKQGKFVKEQFFSFEIKFNNNRVFHFDGHNRDEVILKKSVKNLPIELLNNIELYQNINNKLPSLCHNGYI